MVDMPSLGIHYEYHIIMTVAMRDLNENQSLQFFQKSIKNK